MSSIDQAFIHAYDIPPTAPTPTASERVAGPHFRAAPPEVIERETASERRPLSSFAAPTLPPRETFQPVLEVDAFRWSPVVEELVVGHYELLLPVFDQLMALSAAGQSMIGIAGARPGVGATTISCCLARLLVEGGKRVALVDGNLADGNLAGEGLAASLGLACEAGWADALAGNLPLAECVVYSLDDKLAVLPLSSTGAMDAGLLDSIQTSITAGVLRYHYDLVLFDLGAPAEGAQQRAAQSILNHCRLDASLVVVEPHNPVPSAPLLDLLGEGCLGSISNAAG